MSSGRGVRASQARACKCLQGRRGACAAAGPQGAGSQPTAVPHLLLPLLAHHAAAPSPTSSRWSCGEGPSQPPAQQGRAGAAAPVAALAAHYWQPSLSLRQTTMAARFVPSPSCLYSLIPFLALRMPAAPCHTNGHNHRSGQCNSRGAEHGCRARWATAAVQQGARAWGYVTAALCAIYELGSPVCIMLERKNGGPWGERGSVYRAVPSLVCTSRGRGAVGGRSALLCSSQLACGDLCTQEQASPRTQARPPPPTPRCSHKS